jgi:uncharacterized integral membrane protein (TIGR00697 family)
MTNLLIIGAIFIVLLAGSIVSFRLGLKWIYVYAAATTGAIVAMNFLQVNVFGQLLFVSEVFFAANFLITDIVEEHYGKRAARKIIPIVIISWVFIWLLVYLASFLTPAETDTFHQIISTLAQTYTPFTIAMIVVIYSILQYVDTGLYAWIKKKTNGKYLWLRNNGATILTQTLDVFLSYCIMIKILFPVLTWPEIGSAMFTAAVFKYVMALVDTPFVYLSYKFKPKELTEAAQVNHATPR